MAQRIYIKVIGFSDEERHALNTVFRLSEQCQTMYQLWSAEAAEPARMALLDGDSWEARVEAESPQNEELKIVWIGADPPARAWRSFRRPIAWPDVVQAMDVLFVPNDGVDLDLGLDDAETAVMSTKRALIISSRRDDRLYLRARLALAKLTQADEAESANHALELMRDNQYDVALVDFGLPDMDTWELLKALRQGKRAIPYVGVTKADRSVPERVRAWLSRSKVSLFDKPPHPGHLNAMLKRASAPPA